MGGVGEALPRKKTRHQLDDVGDEADDEARYASSTAVFIKIEGDEAVQSLQSGVNALSLQRNSATVTPAHPDLEVDFLFPAIDSSVGQGVDLEAYTKDVIADAGEEVQNKAQGAGVCYSAEIWTVWMCMDIRILSHGRLDDWLNAIGITFDQDVIECHGEISLVVQGRCLNLICQFEQDQE